MIIEAKARRLSFSERWHKNQLRRKAEKAVAIKSRIGLLANLQVTASSVGFWGTEGEHVYAVEVNGETVRLERLYKIRG